MKRVVLDLRAGRVVAGLTNCGELEVLVIDHDRQDGYRVLADMRPDLPAKDRRAAAADGTK